MKAVIPKRTNLFLLQDIVWVHRDFWFLPSWNAFDRANNKPSGKPKRNFHEVSSVWQSFLKPLKEKHFINQLPKEKVCWTRFVYN